MSSVSLSGRPHVIAVTLSANYFPILLRFLDSLVEAYPQHPEVVVCQKGFSPERIEYLGSHYHRVRVRDMRSLQFPRGPGMLGRHYDDVDAFYARLSIWSDAFDNYENVLYLDIDAVITAPLDKLVASSEFLAFEESCSKSHGAFVEDQTGKLAKLLEEDGFRAHASTSANAGVMLIPRRYRTESQFSEICRLLERYGPFLLLGDQSLINLWMAKNDLRVSPDVRYNYQVRFLLQGRKKEYYHEVHFLHMAGLHHTGVMMYMMHMAHLFLRVLPGGRALFPWFMRLHIADGMLRWRRVTRRLLVGLTYGLDRFLWPTPPPLQSAVPAPRVSKGVPAVRHV